jgi:hypothetical protein
MSALLAQPIAMMLPARVFIIAALLAFLCIETSAQVPSANRTTDGDISGKVTIKGKPAAGIIVGVRLNRAEFTSPTYRAITNQDGTYRINLLAGSYQVAPVAPPLILSDAKNPRGQTIVVPERDNVEGVDFDLIRGGVITGRITDADGHPVVEQLVNLAAVNSGKEVEYMVFSGTTDDRGIYRIFGVRPGSYKVSTSNQIDYFARKAGRQPLPVTYYPDVTEIKKAEVVNIDEGSEATNIDIKVAPPFPGFSASGRIVDESGAPVPDVRVSLSRIEIIDANSSSSFGEGVEDVSDKQGGFSLKHLRNGRYQLSLYMGENSDLLPDQPVPFDVIDQDVTGLMVKVSRAGTMSGAVSFEGATRSDAAKPLLLQAYIRVYVRNERGGTSVGTSTTLKADGSFFVGGLDPGTAFFSILQHDGGARLGIVRIERDGVVQPNGVQIQKAQRINNIRLMVAYNTGTVRGLIKIENGPLPPNGNLVVQLIKPDDPLSFERGGTQVDAHGRFLFEGVAAGTYEVRVSAYIRDVRRRPPTARQMVTVTDNATAEVVVTLDLAAPPGP